MFVLKLVVLLFLSAYGYGMRQYSDLNGFGQLMAVVSFLAIPALYLLPTIEAFQRDRHNTMSIGLLNVLLGWTLIGWVVAMVWALQDNKPATVVLQASPEPTGDTIVCPHCAETVKMAAKVCKHCRGELPPPVAVSSAAPDERQAAMAYWGITHDGQQQYRFGEYRYDNLDDALRYAYTQPT